MEILAQLLAALIKFGFLVVGGGLLILFAFYVVESGCINPMGCKPHGPDAVQADENERILYCWNTHTDWTECAHAK